MKSLFSCLLALLCLPAFAQFETNYTPLQSKGKLPDDFIIQSSKKYKEDKKKLERNDRKKKVKSKFLLQSNFEIDNLILSGRVLFNDPLSDYVNKVGQQLLANNSELKGKIRFYILKSPSVNAISTGRGIIFINIGLLAQVESEAQLAYIISHEIQHYVLRHSIKMAVENATIERGRGAYKSLETKDDKFVAQCHFSKEQESAADEKGYELFKKSKYSSKNLADVYDVLKYSYLPFDEVAFDKSFLETPYFKIPEGFQLNPVTPVNTSDEDDDVKSTHPSIKSRREALGKLATSADNSGKSVFLVGETAFKNARTIARFEQSRLYLQLHDYVRAIYNSYLLQIDFPNNVFLKKNIMYSLAGLAEYSANSDLYDVTFRYKEVEGQSQALYALFGKMDSIDKSYIGSVALAYTAKLAADMPNDKEVKQTLESIAYSLGERERGLDYYFDEKTVASADSSIKSNAVADSSSIASIIDSTEGVGEGRLSKIQKIKNREKDAPAEAVKTHTADFSQYAIVPYRNSAFIDSAFEKGGRLAKKDKDGTTTKRSRYNQEEKFLGLEKVVVMTPFFSSVVESRKEKIKYLKSEAGQIDFSKRVAVIGRKAKMNVELLNVRNLSESEIDKLNDITSLQEYIRDRFSHTSEIKLPFTERARIAELAKKYGTNNFMWTGVISYRDPDPVMKLSILTGCFPAALPFTLGPLINRGRWTIYFNLVYDVQKDELIFSNIREINNRTAGYILDQNIYDTFYQLKHQPLVEK